MKLREKLKNWLFKDELLALNDAISKYEEACDEHKKANADAKIAKADLDAAKKLIEQLQKLIEQLMDVGVDVGFKSDEHSWAVICIQGHPEYVKFMPLAHQDTYHVMQFLKQFQYSNRVVDSPFGYKNLIKDYIFENKR
mgnify:CR=1 FL=1